MRPRIEQTCPDCGVTWTGPRSPDGLCGDNCRAIRTEIAADAERQVAGAERESDIPVLAKLRIDALEGPIELCERYEKRAYTVEDFDAALSHIRSHAHNRLKVWAYIELSNGDAVEFRPDQEATETTGHETIGAHFRNMRSVYRDRAARGVQICGVGTEYWLEAVELYDRVIVAIGA